jgi:hypothetical protein
MVKQQLASLEIQLGGVPCGANHLLEHPLPFRSSTQFEQAIRQRKEGFVIPRLLSPECFKVTEGILEAFKLPMQDAEVIKCVRRVWTKLKGGLITADGLLFPTQLRVGVRQQRPRLGRLRLARYRLFEEPASLLRVVVVQAFPAFFHKL